MPDNIEEPPPSPQTTSTGTPPNETLDERLMRLSKEGHPSGFFVTGSNLGPFTIFSTARFAKPETPSE
jgi:hypothetical protein